MEPAAKRPRRAAARAAAELLATAHVVIVECTGLHAKQSIALTSEDALERGHDDLYCALTTTIVTLHTNERPRGLKRGVIHVGARFDDSADFDDAELARHLDKMGAYVWAADTERVVFVCQAGVNRSSLALCYYVAKYGSCCWQEAKAALITGKGSAGKGWPTLENSSFEAFLGRRFAEPPHACAEEVAAAVVPNWFWRTVATARRSTGGPGSDREAAEKIRRESEAEMRRHGVDPKRGRVWGCWERGRVGRGVWVRGVPKQNRPWEGRGEAPLGEGEEDAA